MQMFFFLSLSLSFYLLHYKNVIEITKKETLSFSVLHYKNVIQLTKKIEKLSLSLSVTP